MKTAVALFIGKMALTRFMSSIPLALIKPINGIRTRERRNDDAKRSNAGIKKSFQCFTVPHFLILTTNSRN